MYRLDSSLIKPSGSRVRCSKCQTVFKACRPKGVDRRKHRRIKTQNLISHFSFDETGKQESQGIGKALDISRGGILIETPYPIESDSLSLMAVDLKDNLLEIKGKLIYSKRSSAGTYLSGIAFVGNDAQMVNFVIKLVKEYNYRKSNLFIRWHSGETRPNFPITGQS
jgi:predicted Zn finger-like uncharacterized protein